MKKLFTLSLLFMTFTVWASTKTFSYVELAYEPINQVEVEVSQEILDVFADRNHDKDDLFDDDIFEDVKPFLTGEKERSEITKEVIDYIEFILDNDKDDINDLIRDELRAVVKRGSIEESYMYLGTRKYKCTIDYMS